MSPLRDPLGFDGSLKPAAGSGDPLLLRHLLPGFDLWWKWRQSKRPVPKPAPAEPEQRDRAREQEPHQQ